MRLRSIFWLAAALLILSSVPARAQRVLLRANVAQDTLYDRFGPNRSFYNHLYLSYLPVVGHAAAGAELRRFKSAEFVLGLRNKFRLSEPLSVGVDVRYVRLAYDLEQTSTKILPTPTQHFRESVVLSQAQLEGFVRLNFGRRGNVIGQYLDLTGWGGWAFGTAHHTEDRPGTGLRKVQTVERGLPYLRRWPYGVGARLGTDRYAAVARYRLSDTFTGAARTAYPELPRWTVGLELGWF